MENRLNEDSAFTSLAGFTFLRKEPLEPDAEDAAVLRGFPLSYDAKVTSSKARAFLNCPYAGRPSRRLRSPAAPSHCLCGVFSDGRFVSLMTNEKERE